MPCNFEEDRVRSLCFADGLVIVLEAKYQAILILKSNDGLMKVENNSLNDVQLAVDKTEVIILEVTQTSLRLSTRFTTTHCYIMLNNKLK